MRSELSELINLIKRVATVRIPESLENIDARILESDLFVRKLGYAVIVVVFGGFGLWAGVAPLESAARAMGTVQVEGNRKPIQHLEGGLVSEILVVNGQLVQANQPLLRLDSTVALAELRIIEGRIAAKRAQVDRLISERDDLSAPTFRHDGHSGLDERARMAIANESALYDARRADRLGEINVLQQRVDQYLSQIDGMTAVVSAKTNVATSIELEIRDLRTLLAEGYVDQQRIRELERSVAQILGEIADLKARIATARVAIGETDLTILQLNKRFKTQVVDTLTTSQEELYDLQQRHNSLANRLERTVIRAPVTGFILDIGPNAKGAVVRAGEEIMAIVPDVEHLVIDARLSPMDIDRVRPGQLAEIRFSVFKDAYSITGVLSEISVDRLVDTVTGESYYAAKIELLNNDLSLLGDQKLVPGMPADVLVKTGYRTLLGYLASPMQRMFENSFIES